MVSGTTTLDVITEANRIMITAIRTHITLFLLNMVLSRAFESETSNKETSVCKNELDHIVYKLESCFYFSVCHDSENGVVWNRGVGACTVVAPDLNFVFRKSVYAVDYCLIVGA